MSDEDVDGRSDAVSGVWSPDIEVIVDATRESWSKGLSPVTRQIAVEMTRQAVSRTLKRYARLPAILTDGTSGGVEESLIRSMRDSWPIWQVIRAARNGDADAANSAIAYLMRLVTEKWLSSLRSRSDGLLDDVSQDVCLRVFLNLHALNDVTAFEPWAYRIAKNEANKRLKARGDAELQLVDDEEVNEVPSSAARSDDDLVLAIVGTQLFSHLTDLFSPMGRTLMPADDDDAEKGSYEFASEIRHIVARKYAIGHDVIQAEEGIDLQAVGEVESRVHGHKSLTEALARYRWRRLSEKLPATPAIVGEDGRRR